MIFATVGSSNTPFDRLLKAVDELASQISEKVMIQKGISQFKTGAAQSFDFCSPGIIAQWIAEASIVISHAGFGIIAECIRMNKRLILIPREHRFKDAEGNQVELAEYLAEKTNGITCVRNVENLQKVVNQIQAINPHYQFTNNIPGMIQKYLEA